MFCCRSYYKLRKQILSLWYPKEPVVYQYIEGNLTVIESISLDETVQRYKVWENPEDAKLINASEILADKVDAPWLWIGASSIFGTIDMTSAMKCYLVYGNTITLPLLAMMYPFLWNWKYLDLVTFKDVDFPNDGITIDDPRVERPTEKNQEVENS